MWRPTKNDKNHNAYCLAFLFVRNNAKDTIDPVRRSKSNNGLLEVVLSTFTPRLTYVVLDGSLIRATSEPDIVLPVIFLSTMIFPPKVSSGPLGPALRFSSLAFHQSWLYTLANKHFFPIFYRTQSFLWAENSFTKCSMIHCSQLFHNIMKCCP